MIEEIYLRLYFFSESHTNSEEENYKEDGEDKGNGEMKVGKRKGEGVGLGSSPSQGYCVLFLGKTHTHE